jgi:signal transduction histidine kinase
MSTKSEGNRWWARRGIRARASIVTAIALVFAMVLAGLALALTLLVTLTRTLDSATLDRARDLASQIDSEGFDGAEAQVGSRPGDSTLLQIVDTSNAVVYSSESISGEQSLLTVADLQIREGTFHKLVPFVDNQNFVIAHVTSSTEAGEVTVVAAQTLSQVSDTITVVLTAFALLAPIFICVVAWIIWLAVGKSLATVDRISTQVTNIESESLHERVTIPVAKDQIQKLTITVNHMLDRLEGSMASQKRFVADASHELRSPLATMRLTLDLESLATNPADTSADNPAENFEVLNQEVERMTRLVSNLMLLAKSDAGPSELNISDVDLDDIVYRELSSIRVRTNITIKANIEPIKIQGDATRISQVVRNLLENAINYAHDEVHVSIKSVLDGCLIEVSDDGPGIALENREAVFERFVRLDEHRSRDAGGSGLGLAIVAEIVKQHGGTVSISDSPTGGALFKVQLPLAPVSVAVS